jgi:hypothetical protein
MQLDSRTPSLWITEYVKWGDTLYSPHRYIPLHVIKDGNYDCSNESREHNREGLRGQVRRTDS